LLIQNTGANNPGDIYISNSYFAGGLYGGLIAAGARIYATNCVFGWAQSHGLYFSGVATTTFITLTNCLFTTNARTAGTCYELFWAGNGVINVIGCQFGTWVNTTPTAGYVAATMNFTAGTSTVSDCQIFNNVAPGTGTYAGRPTTSINNFGEPLSTFLKASVSQGLILTPSSAGAIVPGSGGTIATANVASVRFSGAAAVTGVIMAPGTIDGQKIAIINEGAGSITFAASGSNVADGAGDTILGNTAKEFLWSTRTALWYGMTPAGIPATYYNQSSSGNTVATNDATFHAIPNPSVTFTVPAGMTGVATIQGSVFAQIMVANTAVNAIYAFQVGIDGTLANPQAKIVGENSGMGFNATVSNTWVFTGLAPGSHTIQLYYYWNGTASAAQCSYGAISASVVCT
jgi:hypothetical protein